MNTVLKFDRVVLTRELNEKFKKVGGIFEIANILDDSFLLRSAQTKAPLGVVSFEDFEKYFVLEENFKGWTPWTPLAGFDGHSDASYRTNRKKVQVRFLTNKVRAEACCFKGDEFNLSFGIRAAYLRCLNKSLEIKKHKLESELSDVEREIAENKHILKKMINSLDV
jgi:hypothetical protein